MAPENVVGHVGPVERVRRERFAVQRRRIRRRPRKVERQPRTAVGAIPIRHVVVVDVGVNDRIVATQDRVLGTGGAVRVVPAEWRCTVVLRIDHEQALAFVRTRDRDWKHAVARCARGDRNQHRDDKGRGRAPRRDSRHVENLPWPSRNEHSYRRRIGTAVNLWRVLRENDGRTVSAFAPFARHRRCLVTGVHQQHRPWRAQPPLRPPLLRCVASNVRLDIVPILLRLAEDSARFGERPQEPALIHEIHSSWEGKS